MIHVAMPSSVAATENHGEPHFVPIPMVSMPTQAPGKKHAQAGKSVFERIASRAFRAFSREVMAKSRVTAASSKLLSTVESILLVSAESHMFAVKSSRVQRSNVLPRFTWPG